MSFISSTPSLLKTSHPPATHIWPQTPFHFHASPGESVQSSWRVDRGPHEQMLAKLLVQGWFLGSTQRWEIIISWEVGQPLGGYSETWAGPQLLVPALPQWGPWSRRVLFPC